MSFLQARFKRSVMGVGGFILLSGPAHIEIPCHYLNPNDCDSQHDFHTECTTALGGHSLHYKDTSLTNVNTPNPSGTEEQRPEFMKKIYFESQENKINKEVVILTTSRSNDPITKKR